MSQAVITARVDANVAEKLDAIARRTRRTRSWLTARAVERYVEQEAAFLAFVQEGLDAVDRGEVVNEAEADRRIDEMLRGLPE